jgi:mercuric ion binding protein
MVEVKTIARRLAVFLGLLLAASGALAQATWRFQVDGLACPFCTYGIEKKLTAIEGVARVETDIGSGTVAVTMAEGATLDEATARGAVKAAGFSLRGVERVAQASGDAAK